MEVNFEILSEKDLQEVIELCNLCFHENTSMEYANKVFQETKEDPNQIYLIGKLGNKIVSHAKITVIPTIYEEMNTYAILNHVCVHPDYRRHKIATKMLDYISKICRENKCKVMELWSKNIRVAAHACYHHYGFTLDEAGFFSKKISE